MAREIESEMWTKIIGGELRAEGLELKAERLGRRA